MPLCFYPYIFEKTMKNTFGVKMRQGMKNLMTSKERNLIQAIMHAVLTWNRFSVYQAPILAPFIRSENFLCTTCQFILWGVDQVHASFGLNMRENVEVMKLDLVC